MKKILIIILCCWSNLLWSHHIDNSRTMLRQWTLVKENKTILGSFLMFKNGDVYIEDEKSKVVHFPLSDFSTPDR